MQQVNCAKAILSQLSTLQHTSSTSSTKRCTPASCRGTEAGQHLLQGQTTPHCQRCRPLVLHALQASDQA